MDQRPYLPLYILWLKGSAVTDLNFTNHIDISLLSCRLIQFTIRLLDDGFGVSVGEVGTSIRKQEEAGHKQILGRG